MHTSVGVVMYYLLSILSGVVISVMVCINGKLTTAYGLYLSAVIIHLVGVIFSGAICLFGKKTLKCHAPLWAYLGGAIGVLTTFFNNFAFDKISMTSIVALGLLGQSITSVCLDSFGLLGIKKQKPEKSAVIGYLAAALGIYIMMDSSIAAAAVAVFVSLLAGITVVLSRTVNARLSEETSPIAGSFVNHLVGLPICIILFLCIQRPLHVPVSTWNPIVYTGGILGVLVVMLFNITVPKIAAFHLTLLSFVGEIFAGIAIDIATHSGYSSSTFIGGIVISAGLLINMILKRISERRSAKQI